MFHYINKKNLYSAVLILSIFCLTALLLSKRQIAAYGENTAPATSGNAISNENGAAVATPGNIYSLESPDIWLDRTCPLITYEDSSSMFLQHSELSVRIEDAPGGCGLKSVRYCINNGEFIDASLNNNILCIPLEQTGTLHLTVWASDFAGNIAEYSTDVTVVEAPVVSVTVPTDTYLMLYPASDAAGINLVSTKWLIQNNSEVPVYVTLSDFRLISDYNGTFENSYLNLNLATAGSQTTFPLLFSGMKNIHTFRLDAQGSSADAAAILYYKGYITSDFYEYLNQNFSNASLKLVYKFDVDMEYLFTKYSEENSMGIEQ